MLLLEKRAQPWAEAGHERRRSGPKRARERECAGWAQSPTARRYTSKPMSELLATAWWISTAINFETPGITGGESMRVSKKVVSSALSTVELARVLKLMGVSGMLLRKSSAPLR